MAYRIEEGANEFPLRTEVYQSNLLINARKKFDLIGMRIFILGLRGLNPHFSRRDNYFDEEFKETFIPANELTEVFNNNTKYLTDIKKACQKFFNTTIELRNSTGEVTLLHVFKKLEYEPSKGLHLKFSDEMRPHLINLVDTNGYTRICAEYLFKLSSSYAVRLLELLLQYQNLKPFRQLKEVKRKFTFEELRYVLNVPDTAYQNRVDNFKRYVLDIPIKEITERTPYKIHYRVIKSGRRVYAFEFLLDMFDAPTEILNNQRTYFSNDAITMLCNLGFTEKVSNAIYCKCEDVNDCIARIRRAREILKRQKKVISNKMGFLRRAIEENWQFPVWREERPFDKNASSTAKSDRPAEPVKRRSSESKPIVGVDDIMPSLLKTIGEKNNLPVPRIQIDSEREKAEAKARAEAREAYLAKARAEIAKMEAERPEEEEPIPDIMAHLDVILTPDERLEREHVHDSIRKTHGINTEIGKAKRKEYDELVQMAALERIENKIKERGKAYVQAGPSEYVESVIGRLFFMGELADRERDHEIIERLYKGDLKPERIKIEFDRIFMEFGEEREEQERREAELRRKNEVFSFNGMIKLGITQSQNNEKTSEQKTNAVSTKSVDVPPPLKEANPAVVSAEKYSTPDSSGPQPIAGVIGAIMGNIIKANPNAAAAANSQPVANEVPTSANDSSTNLNLEYKSNEDEEQERTLAESDHERTINNLSVMYVFMNNTISKWNKWHQTAASKGLPPQAIEDLNEVIAKVNIYSPLMTLFFARTSRYKKEMQDKRQVILTAIESMAGFQAQAIELEKKHGITPAEPASDKVGVAVKLLRESFYENNDQKLLLLGRAGNVIPEELQSYIDSPEIQSNEYVDNEATQEPSSEIEEASNRTEEAPGSVEVTSAEVEVAPQTKKDPPTKSIGGPERIPSIDDYDVILAKNHYRFYNEGKSTPEQIATMAQEIRELFEIIDPHFDYIEEICVAYRDDKCDVITYHENPKNYVIPAANGDIYDGMLYTELPTYLKKMKAGDNYYYEHDYQACQILRSLKYNVKLTYTDFLKFCINKFVKKRRSPKSFELPPGL